MLFAPASDRAGRRILMRGGHDLISADRGDAWPRRRVFAVPPPPAPSVSTALQLRLSQYPIAAQQFSCLDQPATIVLLGHVVRDRQWWRSRAGTVFVLSGLPFLQRRLQRAFHLAEERCAAAQQDGVAALEPGDLELQIADVAKRVLELLDRPIELAQP